MSAARFLWPTPSQPHQLSVATPSLVWLQEHYSHEVTDGQDKCAVGDLNCVTEQMEFS